MGRRSTAGWSEPRWHLPPTFLLRPAPPGGARGSGAPRTRVSPAYDGQEGDALALPEPRRQCTPRCLPYFSTANASRSTRGRPEVPTTTSLTVRVPEVDQVFCHASARYFVVVAYRSTVATYVPLT